jgi:hypothetical protein
LAGFFDNAADHAATGSAIGGFLAWLGAQTYYLVLDWRQVFTLSTVGKITLITGYWAVTGAAIGIVIQGVGQT